MPVISVPKVTIKVAGQELKQYGSLTVHYSAYHEPSTIDAELILTDELQTLLIRAKEPRADVYLDGAPWFYSLLDQADGDDDLDNGRRVITLRGQDLRKPFFKTPILDTIKSKTASEWLTARAAAHGLKAQITGTQEQIGALVESNHSTLSNHQKEADLLADLSAYHGYVARMDLDTFIWGPPPTPTTHLSWRKGEDFNAYKWTKYYDAEQIRVEVISWGPRKKKGLKQCKATAGEGNFVIRVVRGGLTDLQAEKLAQSILKQAERSALYVDVQNLPGNKALRSLAWDFKLFGVGAGPSQLYYPTTVTHKFTPDSHTMDVQAFNRVEAQS